VDLRWRSVECGYRSGRRSGQAWRVRREKTLLETLLEPRHFITATFGFDRENE
jgi:hypothetical protein